LAPIAFRRDMSSQIIVVIFFFRVERTLVCIFYLILYIHVPLKGAVSSWHRQIC